MVNTSLKPWLQGELGSYWSPTIYGLALGGVLVCVQVFEHLNAELKTVMQLSGTQTIEDVKHFKLRHNPYNPTFPVDPRDLKIVLIKRLPPLNVEVFLRVLEE